MSIDPLALSDIWTGPPDAADYDAIYATLMATERGRWFLTEYASRNRHADTDSLVGAIARVEAAVRGEPLPQSSAAAPPELIEIAAAIGRVRAAIVSGNAQAPDISAAAERIQDVAFALREHTLEVALCDALDASAREICEACARDGADGQGPHEAAVILQGLARRVDDMIAQSLAGGGAGRPINNAAMTLFEAAPAAANDESRFETDLPSRTEVFAAAVLDNENFASLVAAVANSLPAFEVEPDAPSGPAAEAAMLSARNASAGASENPSLPVSDFAGGAPHPAMADPASRRPSSFIEVPDFAVRSAAREGVKDHVRQPAHSLLPEALPLPGPQEDPAELFEPLASPDFISVAQPERAQRAANDASLNGGATMRAIPRPAAADPLAAVRALSEEEVIALFS